MTDIFCSHGEVCLIVALVNLVSFEEVVIYQSPIQAYQTRQDDAPSLQQVALLIRDVAEIVLLDVSGPLLDLFLENFPERLIVIGDATLEGDFVGSALKAFDYDWKVYRRL